LEGRRTERDEGSEIDRNPMLWIHFGTGGKRINCENEGDALDRQTCNELKGVKVDPLHSTILRRDYH